MKKFVKERMIKVKEKLETIFANMEQLRKQNGKYDIIVLDIEKAIGKRNNAERKKRLTMYFFGIPMTKEEIDVLGKYLTKKYSHLFKGRVICVKNVLLKDLFKITSQGR